MPESDEPRPESAVARRRTILLLAVIAVAALTADIVTKVIVVATLSPGEPVRLLGGAVYLSILRNTGAAWHLGAGYTAVLAVVAAVVILVIIRFARRLGSRAWAVALGLVLGGAAGNLVDRLFRAPAPLRGGVVDFISLFGPDGHPWPIFNVADSCLTVGVLLAVVLEISGRKLDGSRPATQLRDDAASGDDTAAAGPAAAGTAAAGAGTDTAGTAAADDTDTAAGDGTAAAGTGVDRVVTSEAGAAERPAGES